MQVSEALRGRTSIRAFKPDPVPITLVRRILEVARYAPSGGNLQSWHIWVLAGEELARFKSVIRQRQVTARGF